VNFSNVARVRVPPMPTVYARELGCIALFRAGEASTVSPFLAPFTVPSSCRRNGAVARARAGAVHRDVELPAQRRRHARSRRSRARRWATRLGRPKPSWERPWATRTLCSWATADSAHWPLICVFYFLNIFKSLQIQKFV
jgi:hypothetical protein